MLTAKKTSRKEELEIKATRLFEKKGYTKASMRDLGNELGIEAASLYSHIKSKEEILQNVCFRMAKEFLVALHAIETKEGTAKIKLHKAIEAHVKVITKDTSASAVFHNEWKHLSEPYLSDFIKMRDDYTDRFTKIIEEGISANEFHDVNSRFAVRTLLSSLNWIPHWYKPNGKMTPTEISAELAALFTQGLKK